MSHNLLNMSLEDLKKIASKRDIDVERINDIKSLINLITYNQKQIILYEYLDEFILTDLLRQRNIYFDDSYTIKSKINRLLDDDENWTSINKPKKDWNISEDFYEKGLFLVDLGFKFSPFIIDDFFLFDIIVTTLNRNYYLS